MSDLPQDLDLKFLPAWLKEAPAANRYADYEGETGERSRGDRDDRRSQGGRPASRGPKPRSPDARRAPNQDRRQGDRPRGDRPNRGGGPQAPARDARDAQRTAPIPRPAELKIDFLPEPIAAAGIARQIKSSGRAYPLFGTSKLFLERPERHVVRVTSADPAAPLFQIGDGPISFDRTAVERSAFHFFKDEYYAETLVEGEPIKGNFSNVARCRSTGLLLGPTNHHGYQPALRKLYEERFSRRMSFPDFQQQEIQIVNDAQAIADWKEQARSTRTFSTVKEAEPVTFQLLPEAEQHFRATYLPQLIKTGQTLECSGPASRMGADRHVSAAVREAWERESVFPQQLVNYLRPYLVEAGLHFFKHRKRMLFVAASKPVRHPADLVFSDGIAAILAAVESSPRIKRPALAEKILGKLQDSPEAGVRKSQLAADLHYLIYAGHVIEFADGSLDLPLLPADRPPPQAGRSQTKAKAERTHGALGTPHAAEVQEPPPAELQSEEEPSVSQTPDVAPEVEAASGRPTVS